MRILALLTALSTPAVAAETSSETVTSSEVEMKVRPSPPKMSRDLRSWLNEASAERGKTVALTCTVEASYKETGRFETLTVSGCPDEIVALMEDELSAAWKRSRIILPEGVERYIVITPITWQSL